jgi:hypothetical protein
MNKYPQINPDDYQQGSPERVLAEYLVAWQNEDWNKMLGSTQLTWRSQTKEATERLKAQHEFMKLKGAEMISAKTPPGVNGSVCQDIIATIFYTVPAGEKKFRKMVKEKKIKARLIRESAPFKADKDGEWGVNPVSALRTA